MSGKKFTYNPPAAKPKRPAAERVVSERGRKELPPGTKGGENLKPDRHYEHKQHAFDSYCKKVLRDIFLMYWFLNMADREIAEYMNMARRTVNTRRQKAYRLLKELMGGEADD